jgi:serine phosphatase RsbU (regulator of sigma subunit)
VSEALNESNDPFSALRLEDDLRAAAQRPAADLVEGSLASVGRFVGSAPQSDDIAVLALGYLGA